MPHWGSRVKEYEKLGKFNMKQSCFPIQQGVEVTVFLRYSSPQPFTKDILNQRESSRDWSPMGTVTLPWSEETKKTEHRHGNLLQQLQLYNSTTLY
jgi:hypothetical protein